MNFLNNGLFGKIGRAGLGPLRVRITEGSTLVTKQLEASLAFTLEILQTAPRRVYNLHPFPASKRFLVASDAAYEAGRGSGGFLFVLRPGQASESRDAREVDLPDSLYAIWGPQKTYIAQLELFMILVGITNFAPSIRGSRGIWFVDNIAALMALVRGRSDSQSLDLLAKQIHAALFAIGADIYFEWIASEANWSDGISRTGLADQWYRQNGFSPGVCESFPFILLMPFSPLLRIFQAL